MAPYDFITVPSVDGIQFPCENALTAPNPPTIAYTILDIADIIRAHSEGMYTAFQMGLQLAQEQTATNVAVNGETATFLGVYDRYAYGVYDNDEAYQRSSRYWDSQTLRKQFFVTYDEAKDFAANGVADYNNMSVADLPSLTRSLNWRQNIRQ